MYNIACGFIKDDNEKKNDALYLKPIYFSFLVAGRVFRFFDKNMLSFIIAFIGFFLVQGFVSVPLAIHISNFSIAISLVSMLWAGIGKFLDKTEEKEEENKDINKTN